MAFGGRGLGGQVLAHEFFGGAATSSLAPGSFPIAIGPFPFQIDYQFAEEFEYGSYPIIREQADQSSSPGIQSLSRDGIWRQNGASWHLGAGQTVFDRDDSNPFRFLKSLGVNIWTKYQISQLPRTDQKLSSANTNLRLAVAGGRLYLTDGTQPKYTTDVGVDTSTFTNVTGGSAVAASSITSDGFNVWTAHGAGGIDRSNNTINTKAQQINTAIDAAAVIAYVRGRFMVGTGASIYDATAAAYNAVPPVALPAALFTHPNSDFKWKAFAEGRNAIYAAGYSGDKSQIYRIPLKSDGTGLDAPIVCAEFDGLNDQIEGLYGYLGPFMFIGQAKGWRFAQISENGDLTVGARVVTPNPVYAFEGQENFVWWSYANFDATHTGLGRLNVQEFGNPDQLVPAYTSDLQAQGIQGNVLSVVTFQDKRVFTVSGQGMYSTHHAGFLFAGGGVDSAYLETGQICYNLYEPKVAMFIDVDHHLDPGGALAVAFRTDPTDTYTELGSALSEEHTTFAVGEIKANCFEIKFTLGNIISAVSDAIIKSWQLRSIPAPAQTNYWRIPVLISEKVQDDDGNEFYFDPLELLTYINGLHHDKEIATLRIVNVSYPITIEDCVWRMHKLDDPEQGLGRFNGTALIEAKIMGA